MRRLRLGDPVVLSTGWRRTAIAFLAGAASTLAMPPIGFWPAMFVTVPPLVWLIDGIKAPRQRGALAAFGAGWWFGFGYFLAGLCWIGEAFLVDAGTFGWLLPFAVTLLPAAMAVYTGAACALARLLWSGGPWRIVTLAAALSSAEWLRGHLFTGFPWNTFGYALTTPLALAQSTAIVGIYGLTFIALCVFAAPAALSDGLRRGFAAAALALGALASLALYGAFRLAAHPTRMASGVHLRIMQPAIPQDGFRYAARATIMDRYAALSRGEGVAGPAIGLAGVTHLIWPESAFPFFLTHEPAALGAIAALLPPGTVLITGAARPAEPSAAGAPRHAYNSLYAIDHDGAILSTYDKRHLVPFGEYLPLAGWLEAAGLSQLVGIPGGFLPGEKRHKVAVQGAPDVLPLICYEAIFPGEVVPPGERPGWLLNLTDDAWFGISAGPFQHFQQVRVRAIEEGLPLVRAANDGISAVVDPAGRVLSSLPLGVAGLLDSALPEPMDATVYARTGDLPFLVAVVLALAAGIASRLVTRACSRIMCI